MRVDAAAVATAARTAAASATRADFLRAGVTSVGDLAPCTSLTRLDVGDNPDLASLDGVESAPILKHITAPRCTALRSAAPRCAQLRVLDVSDCGLKTLDVSGAPRLAAIVAADNPGIEIKGAAACRELATLVIKGCALSSPQLAALLATMPSLEKLSAARNELSEKLDLSACHSLTEVRLGHNDLPSLPTGLGPRLRVLDVGHNPRLGPSLAGVVGGLADGKPWLRQLTLRGTRAAGDGGPSFVATVTAALPGVRVLDDKKVDAAAAAGTAGKKPAAAPRAAKRAAPPPPAAPAAKKAAPLPPPPPPTEPKSKRAAAKDAKKREKKAARAEATGGANRFDPDSGLGAPSRPVVVVAPAPVEPPAAPLPPPAAPPPPPAAPPRRVARGAAGVAVIDVAQNKKRPASAAAAGHLAAGQRVKTGAAAAAALLAAAPDVAEVAEW